MFGLFKKKSPLEKLQEQYKALLQESFELSKVDRTKSDEKAAEADKIAQEIEKLKANG